MYAYVGMLPTFKILVSLDLIVFFFPTMSKVDLSCLFCVESTYANQCTFDQNLQELKNKYIHRIYNSNNLNVSLLNCQSDFENV